jgi:succinate dehydrogenase/fumarate reductase cytochrome b subunit
MGRISRVYTVAFIFLTFVILSSFGLFQFKRYSYRKKSGNVSACMCTFSVKIFVSINLYIQYFNILSALLLIIQSTNKYIKGSFASCKSNAAMIIFIGKTLSFGGRKMSKYR